MHLFNSGEFTLHSGERTGFKIDCDALTDEDIEAIAKLIDTNLRFGKVVSVPKGGDRLAKALEKYVDETAPITLLVDDVFTTGQSMMDVRQEIEGGVSGVVIFARNKPPYWISAVFQRQAMTFAPKYNV